MNRKEPTAAGQNPRASTDYAQTVPGASVGGIQLEALHTAFLPATLLCRGKGGSRALDLSSTQLQAGLPRQPLAVDLAAACHAELVVIHLRPAARTLVRNCTGRETAVAASSVSISSLAQGKTGIHANRKKARVSFGFGSVG